MRFVAIPALEYTELIVILFSCCVDSTSVAGASGKQLTSSAGRTRDNLLACDYDNFSLAFLLEF